MGDLDRQFQQMSEMAERHGVSLVEAAKAGIINRADLVTLIERCLACPEPEATCMDAAAHGKATASPKGCANRAVLEGLRGLV